MEHSGYQVRLRIIYMDIHIVKNSTKLTGEFNSYQPLLRWTMKFLQGSVICVAIRHFL